jgi:hypothetical protein
MHAEVKSAPPPEAVWFRRSRSISPDMSQSFKDDDDDDDDDVQFCISTYPPLRCVPTSSLVGKPRLTIPRYQPRQLGSVLVQQLRYHFINGPFQYYDSL